MIENTSKRPVELHLIGSAGPDGLARYTTSMEAAGQQQLVHSDQLPTNSLEGDQAYLDLGITFGPTDPTDPLFQPAALPPGWTRQASDHDMWSYVLDEHGQRRIAVFYKAAFYDRKANLRLTAQDEDGEWI